MSIEDGDWFREDYRERERKYGGDFSLHSTPKNRPGRPEKRNGNALPIALLNIFLVQQPQTFHPERKR